MLFSLCFFPPLILETCHLSSKYEPHNHYSQELNVSTEEFIYRSLYCMVDMWTHSLSCCFFLFFPPQHKITHASVRNIGNIRETKKKLKMVYNLTTQRKILLKFWCIFFWCFKYAHMCTYIKKQIWGYIVQGVHKV